MKGLNINDDEYCLTSEYVLKVAQHADKIFESSEPHEKREFLKMTLQNLRLEGEVVRYDVLNPYDKILFYASRLQWLEDRNVNITSQLARVFNVFEDFRFIQQLREEMDKVRPAVAIVSPSIV